MEQNSSLRVRVVNPNDGWIGTEYYINGQKIERVQSVDFRVEVDEVPTFTFEMMGWPDIDMRGDVQFSFTPETVEEAKRVIRNEQIKHRVNMECKNYRITAYVDEEQVPYCKTMEPDTESITGEIKFFPNERDLHVIYNDYIPTDLSAYTRFAMIVLRDELLKHGDLYDGFLASIKSAVAEYASGCYCFGVDHEILSKEIIKRIIGED